METPIVPMSFGRDTEKRNKESPCLGVSVVRNEFHANVIFEQTVMENIMKIPMEEIKFDASGLIPAIVQDAETMDVLMLAYMNKESLLLTLEKGETVFWSRSRKELWHKGETSGNVQRVVEIRVDCDQDTLLLLVHPAGPACHTGNQTCFYRDL
jgi:phosphoribosyl-AMP cyclohydrolase/phosphoribosyl-ATP pyrophosphohydrolase/phosphoribosyl-AMP cyclohydrolase